MKEPRFVGLILAAGRGRRLGKGPKAFVRLDEETLLERITIATTHLFTSNHLSLPLPSLPLV